LVPTSLAEATRSMQTSNIISGRVFDQIFFYGVGMPSTRFRGWMFEMVLLMAGTDIAFAQNFPNKVIRVVVGGIGGSLDITARWVAQGITGPLAQPVIVENRPSVTIAAEVVAKAPPDGYTLLVTGPNLWILPLLESKPSYDPTRDFSPLTLATRSPSILVVNPSLPVKSVKELIALAKARPCDLNCASGSSGSASHLAAELFLAKAGVKIVRINYKSAAAGLIDLISGQVQVMFPVAASVAPYIKAGRLRALAVTTRQPSALVPGTPTIAAAGLPGYEAVSIGAIFGPANVPDAIISRLNQEFVRVLTREDTKERFLGNGVESVGSSPAELAAAVKSEMATIGKLIKDAGIRAE